MLWLLALALPVQGFAAVTQASCAPLTQYGLAASDAMQSPEQSHRAADGMAHAHHQTSVQTDHAAHVNLDTPTDHQKNKHANVKCSACATCGMGVAMLPVMPQLPVFPVTSSSVVSSLSSLFPGHVPDGLKRPPKFFLV